MRRFFCSKKNKKVMEPEEEEEEEESAAMEIATLFKEYIANMPAEELAKQLFVRLSGCLECQLIGGKMTGPDESPPPDASEECEPRTPSSPEHGSPSPQCDESTEPEGSDERGESRRFL